MSFLTCFCDLPQKLHFTRSPPSPNFATSVSPRPSISVLLTAHAVPRRRRPSSAVPAAGRLTAAPTRLQLDGGRGRDDLVDQPVGRRPRRPSSRSRGRCPWTTFSAAWPVSAASMPLSRSRIRRISLACSSMSLAWPSTPPKGWCRRIRAWGRAKRLPLVPGRQQHGRRRGRLAEAEGRHVGLDELHGVVDGEQGGDVAARRVDVEVDVLVRLLGLQEEQLGADQVGHRVVDRACRGR